MVSWWAIVLFSSIINVSFATDACGSNATAISGFDLKEYLGVWHQITTSYTFYQIFEKNYPLCVYANYTANADGTVAVTNTGYNSKGEKDVANGKATQPKSGVGSFEVSFYGAPAAPYNIIKMINDANGKYSAALVWSCDDKGLGETLWLLSRQYTVSDEVYAEMFQFAVDSGINVAKLNELNTTQTNCPSTLMQFHW